MDIDHIPPKLERDILNAPPVAVAAAKRWAAEFDALFSLPPDTHRPPYDMETPPEDFDSPVTLTLTRRQVCIAAQCVALLSSRCLPEDMAALFHTDDALRWLGGLPTTDEVDALDTALFRVAQDVEKKAQREVTDAYELELSELPEPFRKEYGK